MGDSVSEEEVKKNAPKKVGRPSIDPEQKKLNIKASNQRNYQAHREERIEKAIAYRHNKILENGGYKYKSKHSTLTDPV